MNSKRKYIVILGDGMSDYKDKDGKTPLMYAPKPEIDYMARRGEAGLCRTVPKGMKAGSDNSNLSVLGYDPLIYYTGRSPLEAVSMGVKLDGGDVSYRCNLVALSDGEPYQNKKMVDYSGGEISSADAKTLIDYLNANMKFPPKIELHNGVSYRHCLVVRGGNLGAELTPPHDISGKCVAEYLPEGENAAVFLELMKKSYELLKNHPLNLEREKRGVNPANSMWFWGEGRKPALPLFKDKCHKSGAMISAVDLLNGIAIAAGMKTYKVEGATGNLDTNFEGKAAAAFQALKDGNDFVYVHVEAADECGHRGEKENKIKAIEWLDSRLVKPLVEKLKAAGYEYSMLVMPDHATPLEKKTHVPDPVPYVLYRSFDEKKGVSCYNEDTCAATGVIEEQGFKLIERLFDK